MWGPSNRPQSKKCKEIQRKVGKYLGSSSIVRMGGNVTTTKEVKYPTQRKYPGSNATIGSSSIITERSTVSANCKVKSPVQRQYPHGRKLGYSNVRIGDDGPAKQTQSVDSVVSSRSKKESIYNRENRNPLLAHGNEEPIRRRSLLANNESMKEPLKSIPPPRTYPHGRNQLSSHEPIKFNEKAPRDPKPVPKSYPHGRNQFTSYVELASSTKAPKPTARKYPHAGGFGVESSEKPTRRRSTPVNLPPSIGSVDPNAILQRCIASRRQNQQFGRSNVPLGTSSTEVKPAIPTKKRVGTNFGFSTIASVISNVSSVASKVTRSRPSRGHTQALGATSAYTPKTRGVTANRGHPQALGFSRIQLG